MYLCACVHACMRVCVCACNCVLGYFFVSSSPPSSGDYHDVLPSCISIEGTFCDNLDVIYPACSWSASLVPPPITDVLDFSKVFSFCKI